MRWGVHDFKGLCTAAIDLSPGKLSVLTGVNSSGKSSVLQSLLMLTQSLYHSGDVVLNGPLVRLGDAADLVRDGVSTDRIELDLELIEADDDECQAGQGQRNLAEYYRPFARRGPYSRSLTWA